MGTDVHMVGEVCNWLTNEWEMFPLPPRLTERNYSFFAALAGVRNGYGFAGAPLHEPVTPLTCDRGWPADIGHAAKRWVMDDFGEDELAGFLLDGCGEHSAGHAYLSEIRRYDWFQSVERCGVIKADEFIGKPEGDPPLGEYCGGVGGPQIEVIDSRLQGYALAQSLAKEGRCTHVRIYWQEELVNPSIVDEFIRYLEVWRPADYLLREADPDDWVRVLFNFDS